MNEKAPGPPVWEQVANYIKRQDSIKIDKVNSPTLVGVGGNLGIDHG